MSTTVTETTSWLAEAWSYVGELVVFTVIATLIVGYFNRESARAAKQTLMREQLKSDPLYRIEIADTLSHSPAAAFYRQALDRALDGANRVFGPPNQPYALVWSLWLALIYSWVMFWGICGAGGSCRVLSTSMLAAGATAADAQNAALILTLELGPLGIDLYWIGKRIGQWEWRRVLRRSRRRQRLWPRQLPLTLAFGGPLLALVLGAAGAGGTVAAALFGLVALFCVGAILGAQVSRFVRSPWIGAGIAGAIALAGGVLVAIAADVVLALAGATAVAGAGAVILGFLQTGPARKYRAGRSMVHTILKHASIDLAAAIGLLLVLAMVLGFGFGAAERGQISGTEIRRLPFAQAITAAAKDPWGIGAGGGLWFTLMLISTLVPTAIHFLFLLASPLALIQAGKQKRAGLGVQLVPLSWDKLSTAERDALANLVSRELVQREQDGIWVLAAVLFALLITGAIAGHRPI